MMSGVTGTSCPHWLAALTVRADRLDPTAGPAVDTVQLVDYPVDLGLRQREWVEELVRELQIISLDPRRRDPGSMSGGLLRLAAGASGRYSGALAAHLQQLERAAAAGRECVTLTYPVADETDRRVVEHATVMEEADRLCRTGETITTPPAPEVYALRRWTVEEFVRQYHGLGPRPWESRVRPTRAMA